MLFYIKKGRHLKTYLFIFCMTVCLLSSFNTFAQLPVAQFTSNVQSGCVPLTVQFNNQSSNATSYVWDFGGGITSSVPNPVITFSNAGNFSVKLKAINATGSDSVLAVNFISAIAKPAVSFSATTTSACEGGIIQFQNQSTNYDSCLWDFGDGITQNAINPAHSYLQSGTFSVTLVAFKGGTSCSSTLTRSNYITINAKPVVTITADTNQTCFTSKVFSFNATSTNGLNYQWNFGDGGQATGVNVNHAYALPGNYNITVTATSATGCTSTTPFNNFIHVLSNPAPAITADVTSGCGPLTVNFTSPLTGIVSRTWNFGDGGTSIYTNTWHQYLTTGMYAATLTVNYTNGCTNTSLPVNIQVLQTPNTTFTLSTLYGCSPLPVQFAQPNEPNTSYQWNFGNGSTSSQVNPLHTFQSAGNYNVTLSAVTAAGCSAQYIYPFPVNPYGSTSNFISDKTLGCNPLNVNFTSTSTNAVSWYWKFGNGDTSTAVNPQYSYLQHGNYSVTLITADIHGCKDTLIKSNYISVNGSTNNFIASLPVNACAPYTFNLSDSSNSVSWLWNFDDGTTSSSQTPTHTYTQPGTYTVSLQTQSAGTGCSQNISNFRTYIIGGGKAAFTYTQTLCPPYIGYFTDSSINAVAWLWNFGDGATSTQQHPTHTYASPGSYSVSLTITSADGCTSTIMHQYAMSFNFLGANASAQCNDSVPPYHVQFGANSVGATSWLWTFGDGDSSNLENPMHIYNNDSAYTITLTIANDSCAFTYTFTPASFGAGGGGFNAGNDTTVQQSHHDGCAPLTINFHNPFLNTVSWYWTFGNGNVSVDENPSITYYQAGKYDVTLIVQYSNGSYDTLCTPNAVDIAGPKANFFLSASNSCNGITIQATDNSNFANTYLWNFGDGTTSTAKNPSHTYTNLNNNYLVTLQVQDSSGCTDARTTTFYANNLNPFAVSKTRACANDSILFSTNNVNYVSYQWNFGDGTIATGNNLYHTYADSGYYTVQLTAYDSAGCTYTYTLPQPVEINKPVALFSAGNPFSNCGYVSVQFTNQSSGADNYRWDFGDSTYSLLPDITKYWYYTLPSGYYDVTLTAYKNTCESSYTLPQAVYVPHMVANFTAVQSPGCLPITVTYSDSSTDVARWEWHFGDGDTSTLQNPVHTFTHEPADNVVLYAYDINGCMQGVAKPNIEILKPGFAISDSSGCNPLQVIFTDTSSNATSWHWNFGDGIFTTQQSPSHYYTQNGTYTVSVIVGNNHGCYDTLTVDTIIKVSSPDAAFGLTSSGSCAPQVVTFTNNSSGGVSYLWDFGDGSTSTSENPSHIYTQSGTYAVSLLATGHDGCTHLKTVSNAVVVPGPVANFVVPVTQGCAPLQIAFTDSSMGAYNYFWSFSDGDTSNLQSPVHTFDNPGAYQVTLIVSDSTGCQAVYTNPTVINVVQFAEANFEVSDSALCIGTSVGFTNKSVSALSYNWNFGDGNTSTAVNPVHIYANAGIYTVTLYANNLGCNDSLAVTNAVKVIPYPVADFGSTVQQGCAPLSVSYQNLSSQLQNPTYHWSLGNGTTSALPNPASIYTVAQGYNVQLIVTNDGLCADSVLKPNYIHATSGAIPPVTPLFSASVLSPSQIEITWQNSAALNLGQYELYRYNDNTLSYQLIYTDTNPTNASFNPESVFIDNNVNTNATPYSYKIQVVNTCNVKMHIDSSVAHTTIHVAASGGTEHVQLSWTPYGGCAFDTYRIYRKNTVNTTFELIAETDSSETSLIDSSAFCPLLYTYKVEAIDLCGNAYSAYSNETTAQPITDIQNQKIEITRSTVINNDFVLTEWTPPQQSPEKVLNYLFYKSEDAQNFILAATLDAHATSYTDFEIDVNKEKYFYRVEVVNVCNMRIGPGNTSNNILLNGFLNDANGSTLQWAPYQGWDSGVEYYEIQEQDENGNWKTIKRVDGNTTTFEDQ